MVVLVVAVALAAAVVEKRIWYSLLCLVVLDAARWDRPSDREIV